MKIFVQQWHISWFIFEIVELLNKLFYFIFINIFKRISCKIFQFQISFFEIFSLTLNAIKSSLISYQKPIKFFNHKFSWTYKIRSPLHPNQLPIYMTIAQFWNNKRKVALFKWRRLTVPLFTAVCADTIFLQKYFSRTS